MSLSNGNPSAFDPIMRPGHIPSAKRLEATGRYAHGLRGSGGTRVNYRPNGTVTIAGGSIDTWLLLGYRLTGSVLRIKARAAVFHSISITATVAEQNVLLSGSAAWVYAEVARHTGVTAVHVAAARPGSDQTYLNWVLYRFDLSGSAYVLGHCGMWDLNVDNPIAG